MSRLTTLLACAGVMLAVDVHAQPSGDSTPPPSTALRAQIELQAQIDKLTETVRNLQETVAKSGSEANHPPQAELGQLVQTVEHDEKEIKNKLDSDEKTFDDFKKGESDRVAQATQQTLGWFTAIMAVGGGIVTLFGALITGLVIFFSFRVEHHAVAVAKELVDRQLQDNQNKFSELHEQVRLDAAAVREDKRNIEIESQQIRRARDETDKIFERLRDSRELFEEVMVSGGAPGPIGNRSASGTQSALDAYNDLLRRANAYMNEKKYFEAFQDFREAERIAPTRERSLQAIDAQAMLLSRRGANNEAIELLQEKLAPFRDALGDQAFSDLVKLQAADMLIRLGQLYKDASSVNAIRAYDDACRLVERSDEPAALERYAFAQIRKADRQQQVNCYVEAVAGYRHVQERVKYDDASLRPLLAEAIFGEGETFQEQTNVSYENRQAAGNQEDWQKGFHSAITCFEKLIDFAKDNDPSCRRLCADGLINVGILRGMLAEQVPEEYNLALASFRRVIELFEQDANSELKERVEKARLLLARMSGKAGA